jgi:hypothetical protein
MAGVPCISSTAFEQFEARLRGAGFDAVIEGADDELIVCRIMGEGFVWNLRVLRHTTGTAAIFGQGKGRRTKQALESILKALGD